MRLACSIFLFSFLAGCGGDTGSTIQGIATFSDGVALPRGVVTFNGDAGSYSGKIGAEGKYELEAVASGTYVVVLTGVMDREASSDGGGMNYDEQGDYVPPTEEEPKSLIEADYSDASKSGVSVTVPSENYDIKADKV